MTREEAIKLLRRDIECLSHSKCSDCILEEACDPMKTPPDSEYIAAYGIAIEALSAIEDIKAEINQLPSYVARFNGGDFAIHIDKEKALQIIDKYQAGGEE